MIGEIFKLFLKLGVTGFGGPAAHIAMMREEVVTRRGWLSDKEFLDLVGAANLIPGPNSTELAIHIGHRRAGWRGLLVAGLSFILPAFLSVLALAVFYGKFGTLPEFTSVMTGIRPVVTAIVIVALMNFRKSAIPDFLRTILAVMAIAMSFWLSEVFVILITGLLCFLFHGAGKRKLTVVPELFFVFLKIGSVLFGSGYVLLAFLEAEFVDQRGWLSKTQLLDAISVGQFTPGPVFTTATFVGHVIAGFPGAILATIGIFLPSFIFVAISAPYIPKLRSSVSLSHFLDGVVAGSFALMLKVCFLLGKEALIGWETLLVGFFSFIVLRYLTKINSAWLIIVGGSIGYIFF